MHFTTNKNKFYTMKKLFLLLIFAISFFTAATAQTSPLNTVPRGGENFLDQRTVINQSYASVLYQQPASYYNVYKIGKLTGALTDSTTLTNARIGDVMTLMFLCDTLTAGRVVTFGNNYYSAGTLTVAKNKTAAVTFIFTGTIWTETARAK